MVRLKPEVIVARSNFPIRAVMKATASIPIVMMNGNFPVESKLVASLARPGGNVTGTANLTPGIVAKRLQLLKELAPHASRVAVPWESGVGGLMKDDRSSARSKIPILGDLPLIGWLFRKTGNSREKTELLVFITPHVMTTSDQARAVTIGKEAESRSPNLPHRILARRALEDGRRFYSERSYEEALVEFDKAEKLSPELGIRKKARKWRLKAGKRAGADDQ